MEPTEAQSDDARPDRDRHAVPAAPPPPASTAPIPPAPPPAVVGPVPDLPDLPSRMVHRPGRVAEWLGRVLFAPVAFDDQTRALLGRVLERGTPVYVLYARSLLDYMYFGYAFVRFGLPLVFFAESLGIRWIRPRAAFASFWRRLFGRERRLGDVEALRLGLLNRQPCLVSLKRPFSLVQFGGEPQGTLLKDVVALQRESPDPLVLVPLGVNWHQTPESYRRSVPEVLLGDPQAPGRLRKLLSFIWNRKRARVAVGHPIDLPDFLAEQADGNDEAVAARLKFALANEFLLGSKAIRGPVLKGARRIIDEVLRSPAFLEEVEQVAAREGYSPAAQVKRARVLLKKMAADFSFATLEAFAMTLGLVFGRLFTGVAVDTRGLQSVREAARSGPIVLVSAHRSHLDYLVYSWIFYTHGLIAPHIASGDNLSFWPMGGIFRRSGAFFIKRSTKGNLLYGAVLRHYVRKLLKDGYWLEFFIEGTRSRSGKTLAPKYGLLSLVVDAVASGAAADAQLIPSSVTYERVVEMATYRKEAEGAEKKKESVAVLAASAKVLGSRYGRMYVQFDRPLGLADFLRRNGVAVPLPAGEQVPRDVIRRLAHVLSHRIDRSLVVTPQQLLSFALLTHPGRGMERERLLERVGFLVGYLARRGANLSDPLAEALREQGLLPVGDDAPPADLSERGEAIGNVLSRQVDEVVRLFAKDKLVRVGRFAEDAVVSAEEGGRPALDYHKNGLVHHFVDDALVAVAALRLAADADEPFGAEALEDETRRLSLAFKHEFIYGVRGFPAAFRATLDRYVTEGLLRADGDRLRVDRDARDAVRFFAAVVKPFLEAYGVVARAAVAPGAPAGDRDLVKFAMRLGKRMFSTGDVELPESVNVITFTNAVAWMADEVEAGRVANRAEAAESLRRAVEGVTPPRRGAAAPAVDAVP